MGFDTKAEHGIGLSSAGSAGARRCCQRAASGAAHRPGQRRIAEHDVHDRRGAVHHAAADCGGDGRLAGVAGLAAGRGDCRLRRAGLGGAGRGDAGGGWVVHVSARDLWARGRGPLRLVSLYFSAWVQRAVVDRLGLHRFCGVCVVSAAGAGASDLRCLAGRSALDQRSGGRRLRGDRWDALPRHSGHPAHGLGVVGRRDGGHGGGADCRVHAFSSGTVTNACRML